MFRKYINYNKQNTTLHTHTSHYAHTYLIMHTYIPHYAHTHTTSHTHNRHSESHRRTFWHIKLKKILDLFFWPSALSALMFLNFQILVPPSMSFHPDHFHYCWKSNSLVSPVILSKLVQVLWAEMPSVFDPLFIDTSRLFKRISTRLKLEMQIPKIKIYLLSSPGPTAIHLLASSCTLSSWPSTL